MRAGPLLLAVLLAVYTPAARGGPRAREIYNRHEPRTGPTENDQGKYQDQAALYLQRRRARASAHVHAKPRDADRIAIGGGFCGYGRARGPTIRFSLSLSLPLLPFSSLSLSLYFSSFLSLFLSLFAVDSAAWAQKHSLVMRFRPTLR